MRKVFTTAVMLSGLLLLAPAMAQAQSVSVQTNVYAQQFLSKRAFNHPVPVAQAVAEQAWEGTSMMVGEEAQAKPANILTLHHLSRRAF